MFIASIVTYHTPIEDLIRVVECVIRSEIDILYVIDNSSNDSLREVQRLSSKIVYIHSANLGYGSGHNVAIKKAIEAGVDYHIVLNPDIYWSGDVIGKLHRFMDENPSAGLVMPKIIYPNGDMQYLCKLLPTPLNIIRWQTFM